jgi:hypothetical protein
MKSTSVAVGQQPKHLPLVNHMPTRPCEQDEFFISCYENEVPFFAECELDRLYGNFFSTVAQFKVYERIENASTYVVRRKGMVVTVFVFCREMRTVRVINEGIKIEADDMYRFCRYIFDTYKEIEVVTFYAVQVFSGKFYYPSQRVNCLEDIVLALPCKTEEYLTSLGKATRKTIKNYMSKFKRNFPSFRNASYVKEEASEQHIREIIGFNRIRMSRKNKVSAFDEEATKRIVQMVKVCGLVTIATIDGKICAGSISYRVGDNYFMHVCAHDPVYDDYRLGILYCYLTICECIARGGKECHLLWGRQAYKFSLLGVQRDLDHVLVYRSRVHFVLNIGIACRATMKGKIRQVTLWLQEAKHQNGLGAQLVVKSWDMLKKLRHR